MGLATLFAPCEAGARPFTLSFLGSIARGLRSSFFCGLLAHTGSEIKLSDNKANKEKAMNLLINFPLKASHTLLFCFI